MQIAELFKKTERYVDVETGESVCSERIYGVVDWQLRSDVLCLNLEGRTVILPFVHYDRIDLVDQ